MDSMKRVWFEHTLHGEVFRSEAVDICVYFLDSDKCTLSDNFSSPFFLGNLQNILLWNLLSMEQDLFGRLPEFSGLEPLSYLPIAEDLMGSVETRLDSELQISAEGVTGGKRSFHWDRFLLLIHQKIFGNSQSEILIKMKKIFDLKLRNEHIHKVGPWVELSMPLETLPILGSMVQNFVREQQVSYQSGGLKFTKQPLAEFGIQFPNGCFYESTGYGTHCFFLSDLETMFLFQTPAQFPVVWYVFLRILSEMDYFDHDLDSYFSRLEESIRLYPWTGVETHSQDSE